MYLFMGDADKIVHKIIKNYNIKYVAFNLDCSPYSIKRDTSIIKLCEKEKIQCITNDWDTNLLPTERMLNKELSINNDLQYSDKIEFLKNHIIHLNNMIVNGWNAPKLN